MSTKRAVVQSVWIAKQVFKEGTFWLQAVASADRRQSKSGKADQRVQRKKGSKALWVTEKAK